MPRAPENTKIKTRLEIRTLLLKSGLFETENKNGVLIPRGAYRLRRTQKGFRKIIVRDVRVRGFLSGLENILFSYQKKQAVNIGMEELADEVIGDFRKFFSGYGLDQSDTDKFFAGLNKTPFRNFIRKKIAGAGAQDSEPKRARLYHELYSPLIGILKEYLYPDTKTGDIVYHHMARLLVACEAIEQTDLQKAYQKIKKDIYRARHNRC